MCMHVCMCVGVCVCVCVCVCLCVYIYRRSGSNFWVFTARTPTASLIALALFLLRLGIGGPVLGDHRYVSWPESAAAVPHLFALCKCTTALPFRKWHGEVLHGPHHPGLHRTGRTVHGGRAPGRIKIRSRKQAVLLQPRKICGMHSGSSTRSKSTKVAQQMPRRKGSLL